MKFRMDVKPLKTGKGIESHMVSAHTHDLRGHHFIIIDRRICDYEQARALRDWLNCVLGEARSDGK